MASKMSGEKIDAVLAMVHESAAKFSPEEEDFLEEYTAVIRRTKSLPEPDSQAGDEFSAPFLDTQFLLGVGLVLLGQIAAACFEWVCQKSLEHGVATFLTRLRAGEKTELVEEASRVIAINLHLPQSVDHQKLKEILESQLEALTKNPQLVSKIGGK